ncbi:uncharacterized protein BCR38DRAFT_50986 [Pseudomassariella vexata]|uniref:Uncharacterized protein n=1 Tax=Pseudomassariella vexata TaxID=1141098 RepID=A0A1Y2DMP3_9PEZI|nr:uncharacterized protein BCR38DRAFT_50986 [Pseudomassariella vexata]ORY59925.1 hypothetical protein BCR38DRAFT_50986 [Pseudomassariella vexata]
MKAKKRCFCFFLYDGYFCFEAGFCSPTLGRTFPSPGAIANKTRANTSEEERGMARDALEKYVLQGNWRSAEFRTEPGRGPDASPGEVNAINIGMMADDLELLAPAIRRPVWNSVPQRRKSCICTTCPFLYFQDIAASPAAKARGYARNTTTCLSYVAYAAASSNYRLSGTILYTFITASPE